jgi:CRISPR-associated protein Csc3
LRRNGFNLPKGSASNHELLYFHFVPDYFFTMESWEMINTIMGKFSDEARIRMSALASKIFNSKYIDGAPEIEGDVDVYDSWINDMTAKLEDEGSSGMDMAQYMAQGYDNIIGNTSIVFYKPSTSVTEFHFFGVYIATLIAAYTGMRVVVSQSPIPSIRGRDFKEMVALDSINSHVTDFYGKFCPLSSLEDTLRSTSALINLFYASSGLKDSLLPKFLRIIRNEPLPGSYMLKMLYRNSDSGYAEINVNKFLDSAQFLDYATQR